MGILRDIFHLNFELSQNTLVQKRHTSKIDIAGHAGPTEVRKTHKRVMNE
jgi:hypothetical protein